VTDAPQPDEGTGSGASVGGNLSYDGPGGGHRSERRHYRCVAVGLVEPGPSPWHRNRAPWGLRAQPSRRPGAVSPRERT